MPKRLTEDQLCELPELEEMQFGRNYVRQLYSPSQSYSAAQYRYWLHYLESLAMSCFKWTGVPAGIDVRAMEYIMLWFGQGAMFVEDGGHLFAMASASDNVNMYYNPNRIQLTAPNGQVWSRHCESWADGGIVYEADAAMLFDNLLRCSVRMHLKNYAQRLARIDSILDVNTGAQRTPYLVAGSEESRKTRQRIIKDLSANNQYIEVNDAMPGGVFPVTVLQTEAPFVADKLQEVQQKILNQAVTFLGIDNTNNEKRERMIDAEATANNEQLMTMRRSRLEARRMFCKRANDLFGLDIWCDWGIPHLAERSSVQTSDDSGMTSVSVGEGGGN